MSLFGGIDNLLLNHIILHIYAPKLKELDYIGKRMMRADNQLYLFVSSGMYTDEMMRPVRVKEEGWELLTKWVNGWVNGEEMGEIGR